MKPLCRIKNDFRIAIRIAIPIVLVILLLAGLLWLASATRRYAMFIKIDNMNGNMALAHGVSGTETSRAFWFSFEGQIPQVNQTITVDYDYKGGEPYKVNCWSDGIVTWLVVNLVYADPEWLGGQK